MYKSEFLEKVFMDYAKEANAFEHYMALRKGARQHSTITELGVYHLGSSFAILLGLIENPSESKSFLAIDSNQPPDERLRLVEDVAKESGIRFSFVRASDFDIELQETDMLHIDTYHTYRHLTYELEKFSPVVKSHIILHDTSHPFGYSDENAQSPNLEIESRYPPSMNRVKVGLWPAVEDFLQGHSGWKLLERNTNGPGYTILQRL